MSVCFSHGEVPGIDAFFSDQQTLQLLIAPDGKRLASIAQRPGARVLSVNTLDGGEEWVFGSNERSVLSFHWIDDGTGLIQVATTSGREIWVARFSSGKKPIYRTLVSLAPTERLIGVEGHCFFTRKTVDADRNEISVYDIDFGRQERLATVTAKAEDVVACRKFALLHTFEADGSAVLWKVEGETKRLRTFSPEDSFRIVQINPDGETAWILTNQGNAKGLTGLHRIRLNDGKSVEEIADPMARGDVVHCVFAPGEASPAYVEFAHPESKGLWMNQDWKEVTERFGGYVRWRPVSFARPGVATAAFQATSVSGHPQFLLVDREKSKLLRETREYPALADIKLGRSFSAVIPFADGLEIPTIITLPPNWLENGNKPAPTIVFPHGGPFIHTRLDFDPRVQFLASRGYVVLQPNYRGSTGFGRRHQSAARRNWGPQGIQQDLDRVVDWAVKGGYTDPDAVGVFGGSFGGYLALSTACFRPERYRCAAAFFAPSCMAEVLRDNPAGISPSASLLKRYFGDPQKEDERDEMIRRSPRYTEPRLPLLVYHGMRDPLIAVSNSVEMVKRAASARGEAVLLLDPMGSHGFSDTEAEIAAYTALEQFFARHLGGALTQASGDTLMRIEQWKAEGQHAIGH